MVKRNEPLTEQLRPFAFRFLGATLYFAVLAVLGTIGFVMIEGWSWFDAVYMSVVTLSSVGFSEVHPLSPPGRTLAMGLIILGVTGLGLWWGLTTALIVELDLSGWLRRRRIMKNLSRLKNHYIICGGGRMGRVVIEEMERSGKPIVVIDNAPERVARAISEHPDISILEADATHAQTLEQAGIERAAGLAGCLADDADNLFLCVTARGIRPSLPIVCRAYDEESLDKLRRAGADHVISPNITGGARMASMLLRPSVVSFLDAAMAGPADVTLHLEEAPIVEGGKLAGLTLLDAKIPQRTGLIVLAVRKGGLTGSAQYNPGPETTLEVGDVIIVLGRLEQIDKLREYLA